MAIKIARFEHSQNRGVKRRDLRNGADAQALRIKADARQEQVDAIRLEVSDHIQAVEQRRQTWEATRLYRFLRKVGLI